MKRVNTFIDMDTELVKGSKTKAEVSFKRAREELESDNSKKQRIDEHVEAKGDDDQEVAKMNKHMEIVEKRMADAASIFQEARLNIHSKTSNAASSSVQLKLTEPVRQEVEKDLIMEKKVREVCLVQTRGWEAAVGITWKDFKTLAREEFCPNNEMQKLETKFGVTPWYILCHSPPIRAMVEATEPTTIQSVILKPGMLTIEAIRKGALKKISEKRGNNGSRVVDEIVVGTMAIRYVEEELFEGKQWKPHQYPNRVTGSFTMNMDLLKLNSPIDDKKYLQPNPIPRMKMIAAAVTVRNGVQDTEVTVKWCDNFQNGCRLSKQGSVVIAGDFSKNQ
ncbi:hypothetical protein Tco_0281207 [Tanacetum coccineum]